MAEDSNASEVVYNGSALNLIIRIFKEHNDMTTPEETKFLGIPKSQLPIAALMVAILGVIIGLFALQTAYIAAVNANVNSLRAEMIAFRAETNSNDNALRSDFREDVRALDARVDALTVVVVEMNARVAHIDARLANTELNVENIERMLPDYNAIEARFSAIERDQTRINQRIDALPNPE